MNRRKNQDWDALKTVGGPLTSAGAIDEYIVATDVDEGTKEDRLCLEIRLLVTHHFTYQKQVTCSASRITTGSSLLINTRVLNVKLYLNNITSNAAVTVGDFTQAKDVILRQ